MNMRIPSVYNILNSSTIEMLVYPSASIYTFRPRNVKMNITFTIYNLNVLIFSICVQYLVLSLYRAIRFENYGTAFDTFLIQNLLFFFLVVYVCIMIALFILEKRTEENPKQNNEAFDADANTYSGTVAFPADQQSQVMYQYTPIPQIPQIPQSYETQTAYQPQMTYIPTQPNPTTASAPKKNSLLLLINSAVKSCKIALVATMTLLLHSVLGCWTLDYSLDVCVFTWNGNVRVYFGVFYILMLLSGLISLQVIDVNPLTNEGKNLRPATVYFLFVCTVLLLHRSYIQKIDEVCLYKTMVDGIPVYDAAQLQDETCNGVVSIFTADERSEHSSYTHCRISDISQIEVAGYNVLFIGSIVVNLIFDLIVFVPQIQRIASIIRTIFYILAFVYTVNYISTPKSRIPEVPLFLIFAFGVVRELINVFSPSKVKIKGL